MRKTNLLLASVVFGGGLLLASTPATASGLLACTESQKSYARTVIGDVCGSGGGTAYIVCDGANISFKGVICN